MSASDDIRMKEYSTIHATYLSFYSKDLYRDVGQRWGKTAFLYLFLLLAISWIPIMFKMQSRVAGFIDNEAPKLIQQVPEIKIENGMVTADVETPYVIKNPETGTPLIVIDTSGTTESIEGTDALVLITKNRFIMKRNDFETRSIDLSQFDDVTIDRSTVRGWADSFRQWFIVLLYPFVLLGSYAYRLIQALFYALIGKIFARNMAPSAGYQVFLSLSMVAITPIIVLNTVYNYFDITLPFWWFICFIIAMIYLFFAIRSYAGSEPASPSVVH